MEFLPTDLPGVVVVRATPCQDARGSFSRLYCEREFAAHGLTNGVVQTNLSISRQRHCLRGLHYQCDEGAEDKLVRCIQGTILDVVVDLRPESPTYLRHFKVELSSDNNRSLYVPKGLAHGFLTLCEDCAVLYHVSQYYSPAHERGLRWNDPQLAIGWPTLEPVISAKDAAWPMLNS
jgi:dTDP-4-dehydrorhamnose 3,5-epimerase